MLVYCCREQTSDCSPLLWVSKIGDYKLKKFLKWRMIKLDPCKLWLWNTCQKLLFHYVLVLGKGDPGCSCVLSRPHHALAKKPRTQCTEISSFEVIPIVKWYIDIKTLHWQQFVLFLLWLNLPVDSCKCRS